MIFEIYENNDTMHAPEHKFSATIKKVNERTIKRALHNHFTKKSILKFGFFANGGGCAFYNEGIFYGCYFE